MNLRLKKGDRSIHVIRDIAHTYHIPVKQVVRLYWASKGDRIQTDMGAWLLSNGQPFDTVCSAAANGKLIEMMVDDVADEEI